MIANITKINQDAVIRDAIELTKTAFTKLPDNYFDKKDASTHLFNNIMRLSEGRDPQPIEDQDYIKNVIRTELERNQTVGLYAGVPWCEKICKFCNFAYSISTDDSVHKTYIDNLISELEIVKSIGMNDKKVNSFYFGGGTPTILSEELLDYYLNSAINSVSLSEKASITCEGAVSTITENKLDIMLKNNVTRFSMGIQMLEDKLRKEANLLKTGDEVLDIVRLTNHKFDMVNLDLIYGYPNQSLESWFDTVLRVAQIGLPSITLYRLEVRERTANKQIYKRSSEIFKDEMHCRIQYFIGKLILEEFGYVESPLGWWIKREKINTTISWEKHMQGWTNITPYIGVGQGAFSLSGAFHYENEKNLKKWEESISEGNLPLSFFKQFSESDRFIFSLIRSLRTAPGVKLSLLEEKMEAFNLTDKFLEVAERNVRNGLFDKKGDEYLLTDSGKALIHWLIDEFVITMGGIKC
ncbi:coproporphyrinogen-III oxidase family protein [Bacillus thuringiensis]|uniref:coproporphyrinogen-III oxidase family protein n=1 Tax=Bacillus thuringiensis TaxID=1428 RepID=UPI000BF6671A|nr:radical SAM protein [Bacillus thuringiensis]PFJ54322.1 radical SAM protein [Bacillus thuringiensis]